MSAGKSGPSLRQLVRHPVARRFLKFAIVGASSTLLDIGIFHVLVRYLGWSSWQMRIAANCISFSVGVTNGFVWNRLWTFGATAGHAPTQYVRFVLVNLVGLALDTLVVMLVWPFLKPVLPRELLPAVAKVVAIPPVALWNFTAHSLWTFAPEREAVNHGDAEDTVKGATKTRRHEGKAHEEKRPL